MSCIYARKICELETSLKADKLVSVTSFAQEERQRTPNSVEQAIHFDSKGLPTMRTQKRDFFAPMPADAYGLRSRFEIMGALMEMLKMRHMSNAIIASASLPLMKDYVDWLCGKSVWGYVVKGSDGKPISCPSLTMVCNYDFAVRELQHKLMKNSKDYKTALDGGPYSRMSRSFGALSWRTIRSESEGSSGEEADFGDLAGRRASAVQIGEEECSEESEVGQGLGRRGSSAASTAPTYGPGGSQGHQSGAGQEGQGQGQRQGWNSGSPSPRHSSAYAAGQQDGLLCVEPAYCVQAAPWPDGARLLVLPCLRSQGTELPQQAKLRRGCSGGSRFDVGDAR